MVIQDRKNPTPKKSKWKRGHMIMDEFKHEDRKNRRLQTMCTAKWEKQRKTREKKKVKVHPESKSVSENTNMKYKQLDIRDFQEQKSHSHPSK